MTSAQAVPLARNQIPQIHNLHQHKEMLKGYSTKNYHTAVLLFCLASLSAAISMSDQTHRMAVSVECFFLNAD